MQRVSQLGAVLVLTLLMGPPCLGIGRGVTARLAQVPADRPDPQYETRKIEGWTVLVNQQFVRRRPQISQRALTLLQFQLYQIVRSVPREAVGKLRTVRIWVEEDSPTANCMAYHPNPRWLAEHGGNPAKARCVEIAKAGRFLDWSFIQPWMLLHELSHAYHDQFLRGGFQNPELKGAYDRAMQSGIYQKVLYTNGNEQKAYACDNPMEYFAEASEAFFGTNDFYPFVRAELRRHDPVLFELLVKLWGAPSDRPRDQQSRRKTEMRKGERTAHF